MCLTKESRALEQNFWKWRELWIQIALTLDSLIRAVDLGYLS